MNRSAALTIALLGVGLGVCVFVASRSGADPSSSKSAGASVPAGASLRDVATPAELRVWNDRGCVVCHGVDARGSSLGPDLTKIVPLYVAKFGSFEAAKEKLVAYLLDPQGSPKLRQDGAQYTNPMSAIDKMFGGKREEAPTFAEMLLRLAK